MLDPYRSEIHYISAYLLWTPQIPHDSFSLSNVYLMQQTFSVLLMNPISITKSFANCCLCSLHWIFTCCPMNPGIIVTTFHKYPFLQLYGIALVCLMILLLHLASVWAKILAFKSGRLNCSMTLRKLSAFKRSVSIASTTSKVVPPLSIIRASLTLPEKTWRSYLILTVDPSSISCNVVACLCSYV